MRFTRGLPAQAGTSVIAAIVLAAVLGAIELGLHTVELNSANTAAQPAAAVDAVNSSTQNCSEGYDYTLAPSPVTQTTYETVPEVGPVAITTEGNVSKTKIMPVQICASGADVYKAAQSDYQYEQMSNGSVVSNFPKTISSSQTNLPANLASVVKPKGNRSLCTSPNNPPATNTKVICKYNLTGDTYQLQTATPTTGQTAAQNNPWTCHISFYFAGGNPACWQKDVPLDNEVNDTAPGNPAANPATPADGSGTTPSGGPTVSSDTSGYITTKNCAGNAFEGGFVCTDVTAEQAQSELQQATGGGSYGCTADPNDSSSLQCIPVVPNTSLTVDGCQSQTSGNSTTYFCGTAETAQAQMQQLQAANLNNCQLETDGYYITCTPPYAPKTQPCPNGAVTCTTVAQPEPPPQTQPQTCPPGMTCTPAAQTNTNNGGGLGSGLSSLLSGLARGLSQPCYGQQQQSPYVGGNGSTLVPQQVMQPNGTVTTVYVSQPTLSSTPVGSASPCSSVPQQQAPYGVGSNGAACTAPPSQPQCAQNATPMPISASGNGCVTSYQCVPINGSTLSGTPTPQISCSPQVADVGESVAISYSCQNSTGSTGGGFSTNNQLSGSTSTVMQKPPATTNTANFGITCTNNGQTASAQCSVQVNQPSIDLVANPQSVPSGDTSSIGWVTAGMQSCVISSPDDSTFTANNANASTTSGVAQTDAITGPTHFMLTCQTFGGQTKTATTQVTLGSSTSTPSAGETVTVNSSVDGQSANHGGTITINWQSTSSPSGSALSLWLIDVGTEQATALVAGAQSVNGTYQWQIPAVGASCDPNSIAPCASQLVAGHSYGIEAALYTPANAFLGGSPQPANAVSPSYSDYGYTPTPFTLGQ